jgi:hypothetical protein
VRAAERCRRAGAAWATARTPVSAVMPLASRENMAPHGVIRSSAWLARACVALALLARRLNVPLGVVLVIGGTALALTPGLPNIELDPPLALVRFLPLFSRPAHTIPTGQPFSSTSGLSIGHLTRAGKPGARVCRPLG